MKNKNSIPFVKIIVSLLIGYHLIMIVIMPNRQSMLYDTLRPYFISYARSFSMDSIWAYYAPNPITYFYFKYEVIKKKSVETYRWPPTRRESKRVLFNHKRFISHSQFFLIMGANNVRRHFIPYLCRLHPLAKEIAVKVVYESRPHFKKAKIMDLDFWPISNKNMQEALLTTGRCRRNKRSKMRDINSMEENELKNTETINDADVRSYEDSPIPHPKPKGWGDQPMPPLAPPDKELEEQF